MVEATAPRGCPVPWSVLGAQLSLTCSRHGEDGHQPSHILGRSHQGRVSPPPQGDCATSHLQLSMYIPCLVSTFMSRVCCYSPLLTPLSPLHSPSLPPPSFLPSSLPPSLLPPSFPPPLSLPLILVPPSVFLPNTANLPSPTHPISVVGGSLPPYSSPIVGSAGGDNPVIMTWTCPVTLFNLFMCCMYCM